MKAPGRSRAFHNYEPWLGEKCFLKATSYVSVGLRASKKCRQHILNWPAGGRPPTADGLRCTGLRADFFVR